MNGWCMNRPLPMNPSVRQTKRRSEQNISGTPRSLSNLENYPGWSFLLAKLKMMNLVWNSRYGSEFWHDSADRNATRSLISTRYVINCSCFLFPPMRFWRTATQNHFLITISFKKKAGKICKQRFEDFISIRIRHGSELVEMKRLVKE